jgi:hypothetical protein
MDNNNIFAQEQYGFRAKSSTDLATYELVNNVLMALNNKLTVGDYFVI